MNHGSEAVIIGSELLLGLGIDTNGAEIGRVLVELGCPLRWKTLVGDSDDDLDDVFARAAGRSAVVVVSGGLGPTEDDRTRFALARLAGVPLELRPELLEDVEAAFRRLGRPMGESNRVQALLPAGARALRNPLGTAPGFWLEVGGCVLFALPGVPRELCHLLRCDVVPALRERLGVPGLATRVLRLSGIGESRAGEAVADLMGPDRNPYVGILASPGEVRLFLTARGATDGEALRLLAGPEAAIRERLGKYLFGADDQTHARTALAAASRAGWTVASAEGFTGGALASLLWEAGADNFVGGHVLGNARLRRLVAGVEDPAGAAVRLAEAAARDAGADAGLAAALGEELHPGSGGDAAWVGAWAGSRSASRRVPLLFGPEADRQRVAHQVFYELRKLAEPQQAAEKQPACAPGRGRPSAEVGKRRAS